MKTTGDSYNCPCPYPDCQKINHYIVRFAFGKEQFIDFERLCIHCKRPILYHASYEIKVTAEVKMDH
jgi:hypothetical protein